MAPYMLRGRVRGTLHGGLATGPVAQDRSPDRVLDDEDRYRRIPAGPRGLFDVQVRYDVHMGVVPLTCEGSRITVLSA